MDSAKQREFVEFYRNNHGELTPEAFLKQAEKESSAFHDEFTWDDRQAARLQRLKQAASLIRYWSNKINTASAEQRVQMARLYPIVNGTGRRRHTVFKAAVKIERNEDERAQVVAWLWQRLRTLYRDMNGFTEFKEIVDFLKPLVELSAEMKQTLKVS